MHSSGLVPVLFSIPSPHGSCGDTLLPSPHAVCRAAGLGALGAGGGWLAPAAHRQVARPAGVGPDAVAPAPLLLTDAPSSILVVSIKFHGSFHIIERGPMSMSAFY